MRRPEWKQENPRDQLVVLFSSLEGNYENLHGLKGLDCSDIRVRITGLFREIQGLLKSMPPGEWPVVCPLCSEEISPMEFYVIVEKAGKTSSAHIRCTKGLPVDIPA